MSQVQRQLAKLGSRWLPRLIPALIIAQAWYGVMLETDPTEASSSSRLEHHQPEDGQHGKQGQTETINPAAPVTKIFISGL